MRIVFASDNMGKLKELQAALKDFPIILVSQREFDISAPPETGLSFIENALIKARYAAKMTNLPAIADDSGLAVRALMGAPGIYSARFAGEKATDKDNIDKLLKETARLKDNEREAAFYCALAFVRYDKDPIPLICQGKWEGVLLREAKGNYGFGYDPIFYIPDLHATAAELPLEKKNLISHRGQAIKTFIKEFNAL